MSGAAGGVVHSLGVVGAAVCTVAYVALAIVGRRERAVLRRGALLLAVGAEKRRRWRPGIDAGVRKWAGPAGAAAVGWVLVGGLPGWGAAAAAAYGTWRWQRSRKARDAGAADVDAAAAGQLPLVADLLAACLSAGAGPREAAEAVGESMGGPVGDRLARAAAEIRLGGEPADAWGRFAEIPGAGPLARCLDRAGSTGAPAA
ncbi:type II secretion system F family protein, partial [Streptomyces sp. 24-1644]|uniref:type II secretion system F family protein n=1 Tax=Streptomyces sp. 24-1644 TaxID=3457315 RepID=UPI003FA775C4